MIDAKFKVIRLPIYRRKNLACRVAIVANESYTINLSFSSYLTIIYIYVHCACIVYQFLDLLKSQFRYSLHVIRHIKFELPCINKCVQDYEFEQWIVGGNLIRCILNPCSLIHARTTLTFVLGPLDRKGQAWNNTLYFFYFFVTTDVK